MRLKSASEISTDMPERDTVPGWFLLFQSGEGSLAAERWPPTPNGPWEIEW